MFELTFSATADFVVGALLFATTIVGFAASVFA